MGGYQAIRIDRELLILLRGTDPRKIAHKRLGKHGDTTLAMPAE